MRANEITISQSELTGWSLRRLVCWSARYLRLDTFDMFYMHLIRQLPFTNVIRDSKDDE